jgi:OmcA/MtrC family decaheme c-type cytochrome
VARLIPSIKIRILIFTIAVLTAAALISAPGPAITPNQKAFYLSDAQASFVRPGLVFTIKSADIAADGTITTRFTMTDPKSAPLDRLGLATPGAVSISFICAYIPKGQTQYVAYTTRVQTSPITNISATQANAENNGKFTQVADGEYTYVFTARVPAGSDLGVTTTIGVYGSRNLTEFGLDTQYSNAVYHFIPNGAKVALTPRDVIKTATCNKCHDQIAFHGGSRRSVELCVLCHTPQSTDPDTGNTVNFPVMIHKIHAGASLPSVKAGNPYTIIGFGQSVNDYSDVVFPADARNCFVCHDQNSGAKQATAVFDANRAACGACHDDVNFATGDKHVNLPQVSDSQCTTCHIRQGELALDASIIGAHVVLNNPNAVKNQLTPDTPGVNFEIVDVADGVAGKRPTVTFTIKDNKGNDIPPSKMSSLSLVLAGPTTDYSSFVSEAVTTATGSSDGRNFWTFANPIPDTATGSYAVFIQGRQAIKVLAGTVKETAINDSGRNKWKYFSVDGSKVFARRKIVDTATKCNSCHSDLAFHGQNRNDTVFCVACHNPTLATTATATAPSVPIDFPILIHKIHSGPNLQTPYKVGTSDFSDVGYPGDRRTCTQCHIDGTQNLQTQEGLLNVNNPGGYLNPSPPQSAVCLACHDTKAAASHALANTSSLGEACSVCHGPNGDFAVTKVHAH